ncbi:MAG: Ig-like domain-containing protein [Hydrogenophaga sp.]|uniref:Ig-like domain-containing protein n=1 Tax=Hydrogenophaga sp. TaxID=1904254 RepID=UPI00257DED4F|nr:Ig-like domain-containing protein [Hydrogenophaga sp.]MBL0942832.1 Ig-like domain-containing protein [Hydrogenophaga sp.]
MSEPCKRPLRWAFPLVLPLALLPALALADGVAVRYDATASPFPSNRYTVPDFGNATLRRVSLPKPDCATRPSDCADIDVINTLDGFSTQPRITVPFTGDIDPASVNSDSIYLVNLGDVLTLRGFGDKVGINQVVWDPASKTLAFTSDELLQERSRYLLVVTNGVRDAQGKKLKAADFLGGGAGHTRELRDALPMARGGGRNVVAASLFTTQTATGDLLKVQRRIKAGTPAPVNFMIGNGGAVRAVFPVSGLQGIQFNRQTGSAPAFTPGFLPTPALQVVPGAVGHVAYGRYESPEYQNAAKVIPATDTLTGTPRPLGSQSLVFQLFLPSSPKPAGGWPVALFGHGFTDSMYGAPWTVASVFASQGIATLSINVVGHGGGALGTLNVLPTAGAPVVVPAGGRGIDQDGNGSIDSTEGVNAAAPQTIVSSRDGLRQTVIDLMQLVRQVEAGIDVDGDGTRDLDPNRIYYAGQSFGGIYGTMLLGVERNIKAGVPNVPGGSITEIARLSPSFRILTGLSLATRQPVLLNLPPTAQLPVPLNFNENIPLRDQPPLVNNVPGAMAIAELLDRNQWVQQSGNPVSYAALIRQNPPQGHAAKPVILQFAKGDVTVPNPTTSAIVRAGGLQDRVTQFRNDLAFAANPGVPKNPHTFLTNIAIPAAAPYAVAAQSQIAAFFASNGALVIDPDGPGPLFEVPIQGPLPEGLNFIP